MIISHEKAANREMLSFHHTKDGQRLDIATCADPGAECKETCFFLLRAAIRESRAYVLLRPPSLLCILHGEAGSSPRNPLAEVQ